MEKLFDVRFEGFGSDWFIFGVQVNASSARSAIAQAKKQYKAVHGSRKYAYCNAVAM